MAKTVKCKALKGCPYQTEGEIFMANTRDAKALAALGKVEILRDEPATFTSVATTTQTDAPINTQAAAPANTAAAGAGEQDALPLTAGDTAGEGVLQLDNSAQDEPNVEVPPPSADAVKLAQEHNIDLTNVKGSGKNGRILKSDVQALIPA